MFASMSFNSAFGFGFFATSSSFDLASYDLAAYADGPLESSRV